MTRTRADLLAAAQRGDEAAWRSLVESHADFVWAALFALGVREPDRSDIFQVVFLKLTEKIATIDDAQALPKWLGTVTRRTCIDLFRRRERQAVPSELFEEIESTDPSPEGSAEVAEERRLLWAGITRLSEKCQQILTLSARGVAYADIAEIVDMPIGSVSGTKADCLGRLKRTQEVRRLGDRLEALT